jgi:hypothetical protein
MASTVTTINYTFFRKQALSMKLPASILQSTSWSPPTRPDALDLGAHLERDGRAFDLQVLDQHHGVAIGQHLTVGVLHHRVGFVSDSVTAACGHSWPQSAQTKLAPSG